MKPHIVKRDWSGGWICFIPDHAGTGIGLTPRLAYMAWWNEANL